MSIYLNLLLKEENLEAQVAHACSYNQIIIIINFVVILAMQSVGSPMHAANYNYSGININLLSSVAPKRRGATESHIHSTLATSYNPYLICWSAFPPPLALLVSQVHHE